MRDAALESIPPTSLWAALVASVSSIAWTAISGAAAIVLGIQSGSVVLVAFGAVGAFDLAGSVALVLHFRHALHHEEFSARHEAIAFRVVTLGLSVVGTATLVASVLRLVSPASTSEPIGGIVVAGCSIVVLGLLGVRKRHLGRTIASPALSSDGWLSLIGCGTAVCTVAGLALEKGLGWSWADPVAAAGVAATALTVGLRNIWLLRR